MNARSQSSIRKRRVLLHSLLVVLVLVSASGLTKPPVTYAGSLLDVRIIIDRVRALDDVEDCTAAGSADFFAVLTIDGQQHRTSTVDGQDDIRPGWSHTVQVDSARPDTSLNIAIFDEDDTFCGGDDAVDIAGGVDRQLDLTVDLRSCAIHGDLNSGCWRKIASRGVQKHRAEIQFRIDVNLPRTPFWGYVYDGAPPMRDTPVVAHKVSVIDQIHGDEIASQITRPDGGYGFDIRVPPDLPLRLQINACSGAITCDYFPPDVAEIDTQPITREARAVVFPGCPPGTTCTYAPTDFFLTRHVGSLGPTTLTSADPSVPTPAALLRENPSRETNATVTLKGANLHSWLEVYLTRDGCSSASDCERHPVTVQSIDPLGTSLIVRTPDLDTLGSLSHFWSWAIRDALPRPGYQEWSVLPTTNLNMSAIQGFQFKNEGDSATLGEFDGVYGDNAYICLGAFGFCPARVRDPLYLLYYGTIFKRWVEAGDGTCAGMAATSVLMATNDLRPNQFDSNAYFANGLPGAPGNDASPPKPATYDNPLLNPQRPTNLWAYIRSNHGVQTSAEFLQQTFDEMGGGLFSIRGDPNARLAEVRANPNSQVICMTPGAGSGHCVTPYAVDDLDDSHSRIWIYDSNTPGDGTRYIEINRAANRYSLPGYDGYEGTGIYTFPIDIWRNGRHAPGIAEALRFSFIAIFGSADGFYTTPEGGRWGWDANGTFIDQLPGAVAISPLNTPTATTRNVPLLLPATVSAPTVQAHAHGGDYAFFASQGGTMLQLTVPNAAAATTDTVKVGYSANRLTSFSFSPQQDMNTFTPRVGMVLGDRQRAVFSWSGITVPAGRSVAFEALNSQRGAAYTNTTGRTTRPVIVLDHVDGPSGIVAKRYFGPITVPNGATLRTFIDDWPNGAKLRAELDVNNDGHTDRTTTIRGVIVGERVKDGLQALYTFEEGNNTTVHDTAGVGAPVDLTVADPAATHWVPGGLTVDAATRLTAQDATRINDAVRTTNEFTLETWVTPTTGTANGQAQVLGLENTASQVNSSLIAEGEQARQRVHYVGKLSTNKGGTSLIRTLQTPIQPNASTLQHIVYTHDALGMVRLYVNGVEQVQKTFAGDLSTWDSSASLVLANSLTGDQPWFGNYQLAAIYSRALSPAEVNQNFHAGPANDGLVPASGIQVLYSFAEGSGTTVHDLSQVGVPLDLDIREGSGIHWTPSGLTLDTPSIIVSNAPATKVIDAAIATNEVTIETWITPSTQAPNSMGRIVVLGDDRPERNTELIDERNDGPSHFRYGGRLRTSATGLTAKPTAHTRKQRIASLPQQVVYTRDARGIVRIYINGSLQGKHTTNGDFANWDAVYHLVLGNSLNADRPWVGIYRQVVLYNRAISPAEVSQHFTSGPIVAKEAEGGQK